MSENERIKYLRKTRGLTLEQFGERVGVGRSAMSRIENGVYGVTTQMRLTICREFGVREEWLRDGSGEMELVSARDTEIGEAVNRLMSGKSADFKRRLIVALSALNEDQWVFLAEKMREIVGDDREEEDRRKVEDYAAELRAQREGGDVSSATPTSSEKEA